MADAQEADCLGLTPREYSGRRSSTYRGKRSRGASVELGAHEEEEEEEEEGPPTWAHELLRLTHEPLRGDLEAMQSALILLGDARPAAWQLTSFFRFFEGFADLSLEQSSVELAVHVDWLIGSDHHGAQADEAAAAEVAHPNAPFRVMKDQI